MRTPSPDARMSANCGGGPRHYVDHPVRQINGVAGVDSLSLVWSWSATRVARGGMAMYLSNQSLLVIILVGIVSGYLAGRVMRGGGFGLIGDLVVGLIGAFIGDWLLPRLGIHLGVGIVALIVNAFAGAVILLLILRLVGGRSGRRW